MSNNIIIRACQRCRYEKEEDNFTYILDGIWCCPVCCSKHTYIKEIIDPDEIEKAGN